YSSSSLLVSDLHYFPTRRSSDLFLEHSHEFRQVEEFCKAGPRPIAGALGGQFNRGGGFPESGRPAVKMRQPLLLQRAVLQVSHQDRKSSRLNSSHVSISYAVFCL